MWFTTKVGFHKKLITSPEHIAQCMKELISTPNTFSARIQALDFTDHLVKMNSSFKVSTFPFPRIMQYDLLSNKIRFHIMPSQSVASWYHHDLRIHERPKDIEYPEAHLLLFSLWRWCNSNTRNHLFHTSFVSLQCIHFPFKRRGPEVWPFKTSGLFLNG